MIEKDKLVELMQKYLQAAKELYDYTTSEDLYVPTPCGFSSVDDPIHMYCTPGTYDSLVKLFDPDSSRVKSCATEESRSYYEFATIGGIPIKILWTADEYEEVCSSGRCEVY